jgi:tetrahydromethanopterin S-methyltransferase subunit B
MIGTLATDITRRLDYTYYGLLEKIAALNVTIASFQDLSDSTSKLFGDFQRETTGLEQDIRKQIGDLHEFQPQMERVEALDERMRASKTRAKALGNRLEAMRNEIERWDKREVEWQMRTNQRLRIFWGVVIAAILAILVAIVLQHWPSGGVSPGFRTIPKALKLPSIPSRIPLPKQYDNLPGDMKDEYAWSAEPTGPAYNGTPSTTTDTTASSGTNESTNLVDHDPLRIFDEL